MKTKQLRRLRSQFGHLVPELSSEDISIILERAGLIEIIEHGERYFETDVMRGIPRELFVSVIYKLLKGGINGQS